MDPIKEKLDQFTDAFLREASDKATDIIRDVQNSRSHAEAQARKDLRAEVADYIKKESAAIQSREGSRVSARLLQNKRTLFSYREQCAMELVNQVKARVADFAASPAYADHMDGLLKRGLAVLGDCGSVTVYLRKDDMGLKDRLASSADADLAFEPGDFKLGGLALWCPSANLRVDLTFDDVLTDAASHFAELSGIDLE